MSLPWEVGSPGPAPAEPEVAWTYDPWRERPGVATLAAVAALGLCALVVLARLPFLVAAGLALACVASFAPALARAECRLDGRGAVRSGPFGTARRTWTEVRRVDVLPAGALLSPYGRRHWLDAQRGLTLPMPAGRRSELLGTLARLREAHGA